MDEQLFEYGKEVLAQLITFVSGASSELWQAAINKVIANGITNILLAVILFVIAYFCAKFFSEWYKENKDLRVLDVKNEWVPFLSGMIFLVCGTGGIVSIVEGVNFLISPKWYAIELILGLVK